MVTEYGKVAVIAGIMGALLLFGLFMHAPAPVTPAPVSEPVTVVEPVTEVKIVPRQSLEMLDPIYSEKAVFSDRTIRVSFQASITEDGAESRLPFWIHNVSGDVINILWDRCSMQLPDGNTVNVVNENSQNLFALGGRTISIAPSGDLFDAFIPISEIVWTDEGADLTTHVFDRGTFTLVLAVERAIPLDPCAPPVQPGCDGVAMMRIPASEGREIVYYTFRFLLR